MNTFRWLHFEEYYIKRSPKGPAAEAVFYLLAVSGRTQVKETPVVSVFPPLPACSPQPFKAARVIIFFFVKKKGTYLFKTKHLAGGHAQAC